MGYQSKTIKGGRTAIIMLCVTLLAGCGERAQDHAGGGPPTVSVAPAALRQVQEFDEFTARLEAPDTVEVRSRVPGTLVKVHFQEGELVSKGAPLFTIDPRPYAAETARAEALVAVARTQAALTTSELARAEKLAEIKGVSQQELDQLRAASRTAQANILALEASAVQARLNQEFTLIVAPVAGRTSRANLTVGNLVGVGETVLTTLVSSDRVYAYFDANEAVYLKYMRGARTATGAAPAVSVLLGLANEEGYPHQGKLDFVDNRLNPATASIRGRAVFDNKDGLYTPGLFARVKLVGSRSYQATVVSDRAITTDQTRKAVLVVGKGNMVEQRVVKTGLLIDGMRVVEGVKPGELVVVDGQQRAFPGAPVKPEVVALDDKGRPVTPAPARQAGSAPAAKG